MNHKIGHYNDDGTLTYPSKTLAGADFERGEFDPPPAHLHNLGGKFFAIGDVWPPKGFDVNAELDKLRAELTPPVVKTVTKADKQGETP